MSGSFKSARRHILVVDDDPLVCEALSMLLQFEGHAVESAISGHQALAIFQPGKYDLVIVDFFMPAMTGDRLAAQIKILDPRQPVVMATAYLERLKTTAQHSMSIDLLIGKPFEMQSLREAISQLTAG